jgi:AraC family transcriptional regulator of adaptative response/methylated-DNA-[protein]-cysteine methyltransferase
MNPSFDVPTAPGQIEPALRDRDPAIDGTVFTAVRTTGIFCRPGCPARPLPGNVERYPSARDALFAGFRPCRRCRPLELVSAAETPSWLRPLVAAVEADPLHRWSDADLRDRGLEADDVRRWFLASHGMTFQAYSRARRLGTAIGRKRLDRGALEQLLGRSIGPAGQARSDDLVISRLFTPLGPMIGAATDAGLALLEFADRRMLRVQLGRVARRTTSAVRLGWNDHLRQTASELDEYFAGDRRRFDVPLMPLGSDFQRASWAYLQTIPYGEIRTYGDGARAIGRPGAVRAFGRANGDNRLAIVVPCHRVIGGDGRLTGYGGGLWRKRTLLDLEARAHGSRSPYTSAV